MILKSILRISPRGILNLVLWAKHGILRVWEIKVSNLQYFSVNSLAYFERFLPDICRNEMHVEWTIKPRFVEPISNPIPATKLPGSCRTFNVSLQKKFISNLLLSIKRFCSGVKSVHNSGNPHNDFSQEERIEGTEQGAQWANTWSWHVWRYPQNKEDSRSLKWAVRRAMSGSNRVQLLTCV